MVMRKRQYFMLRRVNTFFKISVGEGFGWMILMISFTGEFVNAQSIQRTITDIFMRRLHVLSNCENKHFVDLYEND
jgi:hypothetical protein